MNPLLEIPPEDRVSKNLDPDATAMGGKNEQRGHKRGFASHATRCFLLSILVCLAVIIAYNVLINRAAAKSQRRHLLATLNQLPLDSDFLFVGNSLVEAGCDAEAFMNSWKGQGPKPRAVNIALGATSPVEHYLILKKALSRPLKPKYVVYGFFDDQLTSPTRGDSADLVGNRAFSYYFPDDAARFYAPGSWLKKWEMRAAAHVPMFAERSSLWTKVELVRRHMDEVGMPRKKSNRFGRVDDFAALEPKDLEAFSARCAAASRANVDFSAPIREMAELVRNAGAQLILLEMPMPSHHRTTFYSSPSWNGFRKHLDDLARSHGAVLIPAEDWVADDSSFEDATHLNENGAKIFSATLAGRFEEFTATRPSP